MRRAVVGIHVEIAEIERPLVPCQDRDRCGRHEQQRQQDDAKRVASLRGRKDRRQEYPASTAP